MSKRWLTALACSGLILSGCNIIYKQNIQQGNSLDQEDLDQLEIGMTRNQVSFLLGTPAIQDPFHHDRWDYVSTFSRRGGDPVRRLVTLHFENDRLSEMYGVRPSERSEVVLTGGGASERVEASVALPGVAIEDARDYEDLTLVPKFANWTIQAGSFSYRQQADERLEELASYGIDATIYGQVIGDIGFFIIRFGGFDTKAEAIREIRRIEGRTGMRLFVVTPGA